MARKLRIIPQKTVENSGFGSNFSGRFMNKDGAPNVEKRGVVFFDRWSWYHTMINLPTWKFILCVLSGYFLANFIFALIYYAIGIEYLTGIDKSNFFNEFLDVFFFSAQTFTTVGYGRVAPVGFLANLVSTCEAFLGLLAFAIATGLFYGRFSRPRAYLKFSKYALVAPYEDVTGLMFRLAPYKNNALINGEAVVTVAIKFTENETPQTRFFNLKLELPKINILTLNWTVVHKIDESSPFFGFSKDDFNDNNADIEIIVQIRAFDEVFANNVVQHTSYFNNEIIYGAAFSRMYHFNHKKNTTVLDLDKLDDYEWVVLEKPKAV